MAEPVRVVALTLDEDENPDQVTITMPARHLAVLARFLGPITGKTPELIDVHQCAYRLFASYYEDGIDDALREVDGG